jgi:hypothetical protein
MSIALVTSSGGRSVPLPRKLLWKVYITYQDLLSKQ